MKAPISKVGGVQAPVGSNPTVSSIGRRGATNAFNAVAYNQAVGAPDTEWPAKSDLLDIKVQITDRDALMAPSTEQTLAYLLGRGWERLTGDDEVPEIWKFPIQDEFYEVLRPSSKKYADYALRMSEFVRTLSIAEDRSELAVWHDIVSI